MTNIAGTAMNSVAQEAANELSGLAKWDFEYLQTFYLAKYFEDFKSDKYERRHAWLSGLGQLPPRISSLVNLGCGSGRETFALARDLDLLDTALIVGIDRDREDIRHAQDIAWAVARFANRLRDNPPPHDRPFPPEFCSFWLRQGIIPHFYTADIANRSEIHLPFGRTDVDLVYSRCVLRGIDDRSKWLDAVQTMADILRPGYGLVIVVEPTTNEGFYHDFEFAFHKAGLSVVAEVDGEDNKLGHLEYPDFCMKGYACQKDH
jgi:SAM-dependent methyltransferase